MNRPLTNVSKWIYCIRQMATNSTRKIENTMKIQLRTDRNTKACTAGWRLKDIATITAPMVSKDYDSEMIKVQGINGYQATMSVNEAEKLATELMKQVEAAKAADALKASQAAQSKAMGDYLQRYQYALQDKTETPYLDQVWPELFSLHYTNENGFVTDAPSAIGIDGFHAELKSALRGAIFCKVRSDACFDAVLADMQARGKHPTNEKA